MCGQYVIKLIDWSVGRNSRRRWPGGPSVLCALFMRRDWASGQGATFGGMNRADNQGRRPGEVKATLAHQGKLPLS